jgi:hypothetical protein
MSLPEPGRGASAHAPEGSLRPGEASALGTLGWVLAVLLGALLALGVLSWLGPVGSR